ncbi:MAG: fluoride efflux transporter CrcB [SAR202 cluster bacterium]|nr:fluoride efflux transporter CrcB [SAR202 cluster bacterium]
MITVLLVGAGGAIGSMLRYGVGVWADRLLSHPVFPYGTVAVNLAGCLLIGLLAGLVESRQLFGGGVQSFLIVGLLGGFTTFSAFGYQTLTLFRDGQPGLAFLNVGLQVIVGVAAAWAGWRLGTA